MSPKNQQSTLTTKAWAICSNAISPQAKVLQIDVDASSGGCVLAECPPDTTVIGGFNNMIDNEYDNVSGACWSASRPEEKGWQACCNVNGHSTLVSIAMYLPTP